MGRRMLLRVTEVGFARVQSRQLYPWIFTKSGLSLCVASGFWWRYIS
jgi:hypothetical protein